ncbi:MAG TPA: endonuclease MutS2 [Limnochordales bacterium]|nr:endonuclease MutS2 [Limnochordales bacterium]
MDERSLGVLEYPAIIQRLAAATSFAPGRELALALRPTADAAVVGQRLAETGEAQALLSRGGHDLLAGVRDVREAVRRAELGGLLSGQELLDVAATAAAMGRARRRLLADPDAWPHLARRALQLGTFAELEEAIGACIGPDGQVLDDASPELARLRARIRALHQRIRERLEAILRSTALRPALQEALVTVRNGRQVVPVKQEHKAMIPGIVHDTSASGATVFVEPMAVVELNNELQETRSLEEREVERVLRHLSGQVAGEAGPLLTGLAALAELDLALAKARLADAMKAVRPRMNEEGWIRIVGGRHPLLTGKVVPIDVWLGREARVLVITGPNTGGKTVTLKTIGLFCLMAQAGLFVPAEPGTELAVFSGIYADIGDEQSIQQSLSTFSSHMSNIVRILQVMDARSLVLLDELGAGTDPTEGAALAMAILDHILAAGARAVATTHYSELKAFVHNRPGMQNASVEFDVETLAPTYRLIMGLPGRSNALEIAARLGLPAPVLAQARARLTHDEVRVDDLIRNLEETRRAAAAELAEARRLREENQRLREELVAARAELEARRQAVLEKAREEARRLLHAARREAEAVLAELRRLQRQGDLEAARKARRRLDQLRDQLDSSTPSGAVQGAPLRQDQVVAGLAVLVPSLQQVGIVTEPPGADGQVAVQVGGMRVRVPWHELRRAPAAAPAEKPAERPRPAPRPGVGLMAEKRTHLSPELHVRGMTVEEALEAVDKYLDDAVLAGLSRVRIVHGKGTGTLRRAIHEHLRADRRVKAWRLADPAAGGHGVTEAELAD